MPMLKREPERNGSLTRVGLVNVPFRGFLWEAAGVFDKNDTFSAQVWTDYTYFCFSHFVGVNFK